MENRAAHKAIAAPLLVLGLEWSVSAANKYNSGSRHRARCAARQIESPTSTWAASV